MAEVTISYEELDRIIQRSVIKVLRNIHDKNLEDFAAKKHVTRAEIIRHFDLASFNWITRRLGISPIRQNGKGGKIYYSTKKVLEELDKWYHLRKPMEPHT